jgi:hypothetical protein
LYKIFVLTKTVSDDNGKKAKKSASFTFYGFIPIISVHPETNYGHYCVSNPETGKFGRAQGNQGIALKAYAMYATQEIPQVDTEIAQKGHFRMETNKYLT